MLADQVQFIIGVDTHKDTHTVAIVDRNGAALAHETVTADWAGYDQTMKFVSFRPGMLPHQRVWAIEGTGSYGSGLTTFLLEREERVVEIDRPKRPARRTGAKSDELDAVRAAREALARDHLAQPRRRGDREAMRVLLHTRETAMIARTKALCRLKALIGTAPEALRARLVPMTTGRLTASCARLRVTINQTSEHRCTTIALRAVARRILALEEEAKMLEAELEPLVRSAAPQLLEEPGIGIITAAEILLAWSHPGRIRDEAAFAMLAGVAPIPASSGQTVRHRLNRSGDRRLNRALHTIALSRLATHEETRKYAERRSLAGKTPREIRRCLKRHLARRIFKLLAATAVEPEAVRARSLREHSRDSLPCSSVQRIPCTEEQGFSAVFGTELDAVQGNQMPTQVADLQQAASPAT